MYLEHFGLSEPPFRITPHTEFFFAGANRGATLDALVYAIIHDEGIVKISGEVGSGKTMLCRVLMERLPEHVVVVYLANPSLSREDIIFAVAGELELRIAENTRASAAIRALQDKLIELHGDGRQVVVLIDEAHGMPLETLEEIRLLSNLETRHHKLLQLVLFGQPELDGVLARPDMRQLRERITHSFQLEPLQREDIAKYIDFRMRMAGYRGPEAFAPNAIKLIAAASQGLTRRVSILAEKSLLAAFSEGVHQITPKQVNAAIRDSQYDARGSGKRMALLFAGALALAGTLIMTVLHVGLPDKWLVGETSAVIPSSIATGTPSLPVAIFPVSPTGPLQPEASRAKPEVPVRVTETAPAKTGETAKKSSIQMPSVPEPKELSTATEQRLHETREWINATDGNRWFIQLIASNTGQIEFVRQFLEKADRLLKPEHAGLYLADLGKEQRVGIIYGDFENQEAAAQAIARLPAELRTNNPFPRQVIRLK
jgi:MSHA biogenesis protein MshM